MTEYIQVSTTVETREDARSLAGELVKKRLAACVQVIGPVNSTYWWEERISNEEEWLLIIKSRNVLFERLEKTIKELHPYEVPEILATSIKAGSRDYLEWMDRELT